MRVCSKPGCPELTKGRRCAEHEREHEQARGTRQQRGYDRTHEMTRQALLPLAYGTECPLCGEYMYPHQALHLDHTTPLAIDSTSRGDRIVHQACNLRRGAHAE
jgi:hypothetical protein